MFTDPPVNPPIVRPVGFLSRLRPAPQYTLGPLTARCTACNALHFQFTGGFSEPCCKKGDVVLPPIRKPPAYLYALLTGDDPRCHAFRTHFRAYNCAFAFTSVSYKKDTRIDPAMGGIQCFQICGQLFHFHGPLRPPSHETPSFAQLFFYDPAYATDIRANQYSQLDRTILLRLTEMLTDCNPFIRIYKTARERLATQQADFRILLNPRLQLVIEAGADRRRENLPTSNEVTVIIPDEFTDASRRDLVLAVREAGQDCPQLHTINVTHPAYMPLHYVLLFPYGDPGWHYGLQLQDRNGTRQRTRLDQRVFYRYYLHVREAFSPLFAAGRLLQQYIVDAYVACETTALDWLRTHQQSIRADVYTGLTDALIRQDVNTGDLGRRFILPSSFTGSDRFMQQLFQDSMAIVRYFGKPSFFITFTANPRWPEITDNLLRGQQATDRPDLITRVFALKVKELLADLKNHLFGPYAGHVYTIEYQKRGLPHMHLLLFLKRDADFLTPELIDEVVCAELPDPSWDLTGELTDVVIRNMTHGPCGLDDHPKAPCMDRKNLTSPLTCQKRFPKAFAAATVVHEDGYPEYRRRDDGRTFTVRKPGFPDQEVVRDNRWVIPYNPYLLQKFRSHLNVEVCATVKAVKYIHKYVYKGTDRTTVAVSGTDDEITRYVQARYVGPTEAFWRLFEYATHQEFPPVQHLAVHLPGQHIVCFTDNLSPEQVAAKAANARSTLMAFFEYNTMYEDGRQYLYHEFPQHYVWKADRRIWVKRQRGFCIGRMYHCNPVSGERYYLRLLLTVVRGPQSFTHLYYVDGVRYPTYQAACIARGLAENDQEWFQCFDEAVLSTTGHGLRTLFLTGIRQQLIADPQVIWDRYKEHFCDDLARKLAHDPSISFPLPLIDPHYDYGLFLLGLGLADLQQTLTDAGLPENIFDWTASHRTADQQANLDCESSLASVMQAQLNLDQQACFQAIVTAITDDPQTAHFYLQGPGGTGKTFLYKTLCHYYRSQGKTVLCVASTGIAALLLPNGRTSHSQFKIPLELNESSVSTITKTSKLGQYLQTTDLIIWDEVPMQHKYCFKVVHRLLVNLRSVTDDVLFGGVPVVLGGDFAQILPVVPHGSRADTVRACLQQTWIWPRLRQLSLRINMRVRNDLSEQDFISWISSLPYDPSLNGHITLPPFVPCTQSVTDLINHVYPQERLLRAPGDYQAFCGRAILSTRNDTVRELNRTILNIFPGQERTYLAVDSADVNEADPEIAELPPEILQSICLSSLPLSQLQLKIGAPVMLLRNLCPPEGLCNGSRMSVQSLGRFTVQVRLLGGDFDGQLRTIPRIKLQSTDQQLSFTLSRKQFPIALSFAMTINKSQGQSFEAVGVDLRSPVFSHG